MDASPRDLISWEYDQPPATPFPHSSCPLAWIPGSRGHILSVHPCRDSAEAEGDVTCCFPFPPLGESNWRRELQGCLVAEPPAPGLCSRAGGARISQAAHLLPISARAHPRGRLVGA